jgi:hypothetical protein
MFYLAQVFLLISIEIFIEFMKVRQTFDFAVNKILERNFNEKTLEG